MSTVKNHVQLNGNVGIEPTITTLESGKKVARLSLATNENYKDKDGELFLLEVYTLPDWSPHNFL